MASQAGQSLNTWLVSAVRAATSDHAIDIDIDPDRDILASPLPLFHSFGLVPGTWMGLALGVTLAHQADPRDGRALGNLIERTGATIFISTPTFVRGYMRRFRPGQMASLRFAVVGAERCPADLKLAFRNRGELGTPVLFFVLVVSLFPLALTPTPVLLGNRPVPLIGTVSMDTMCVDLRGHEQARVGDSVTLWGAGLPADAITEVSEFER